MRARKTTPTIFRGKNFSLRRRRSPTTPRARAPVTWSLHECFDFPDGSRHKFKMVAVRLQTKITSFKIDTPYPIERVERVVTKYGEAILVTLQAPGTFLKVFLPRR